MKRARIASAVVAVAMVAIWMYVPRNLVNGTKQELPSDSSEPRSPPAPLAPSHKSPQAKSTSNTADSTTTSLTPAQRFAMATNYKKLYDDLAALPDESGEARYFMGKALVACSRFIAYTLEDYEKGIPPSQSNKREAVQEMSKQCEGFYGFKGPRAPDLWRQAAAKGYPGAVAASVYELPAAEAETTAAKLLEGGHPDALERLLPYLQARTSSSTLEVDGQRATAEVTVNAWRLYACSHGVDCSSFLFQQCWGANECGAPNYASYLRAYKPQTYSSTTRFEAEIARAVQARDWRALGVIKSGQ